MPVRMICVPPRNFRTSEELGAGSWDGDVLKPQRGDVRGFLDLDAGAGAGANYLGNLYLRYPRSDGSSHFGDQSLVLCLWGGP